MELISENHILPAIFVKIATGWSYNFFRQRLPKEQWWLKLRPLLRILAKHDSAYEEEGLYMTVEDRNTLDTMWSCTYY